LLLQEGAIVELALSKPGENVFKIFLFDGQGMSLPLGEDRIVISRTAATIDAIPASHSVGIESLQKIGGRPGLAFMVKAGEPLPKKGTLKFLAAEPLKAGGQPPIRFKLWEGDIEDPISSNRPIGTFEIRGSDFSDGVIAAGAELLCEYEVLDSGQIHLEVTVPSIGGAFNKRNFYSPVGGQIDYTKAARQVEDQVEAARQKLDEMAGRVKDERLAVAAERLDRAESMKSGESDPEVTRQAMENVQDAQRLMAETRLRHLAEIRTNELERCLDFFNSHVRQLARPAEQTAFDNLVRTARRSIEGHSREFEAHLSDLRGRNFEILWRQDWFVADRFRMFADSPHQFPDAEEHAALVVEGRDALEGGDTDRLRNVVMRLDMAKISYSANDELLAHANIIQG